MAEILEQKLSGNWLLDRQQAYINHGGSSSEQLMARIREIDQYYNFPQEDKTFIGKIARKIGLFYLPYSPAHNHPGF